MCGQAQIMHSILIPLSALSTVVLLPIFASHSIIFTQATEEERQSTPKYTKMYVYPWVAQCLVWFGIAFAARFVAPVAVGLFHWCESWD